MVITNSSIIKDKFRCGKSLMEYLVYKCGLPMLSYDKDYYYFAYTSELKASLDSMPFYLKLLYAITK